MEDIECIPYQDDLLTAAFNILKLRGSSLIEGRVRAVRLFPTAGSPFRQRICSSNGRICMTSCYLLGIP